MENMEVLLLVQRFDFLSDNYFRLMPFAGAIQHKEEFESVSNEKKHTEKELNEIGYSEVIEKRKLDLTEQLNVIIKKLKQGHGNIDTSQGMESQFYFFDDLIDRLEKAFNIGLISTPNCYINDQSTFNFRESLVNKLIEHRNILNKQNGIIYYPELHRIKRQLFFEIRRIGKVPPLSPSKE